MAARFGKLCPVLDFPRWIMHPAEIHRAAVIEPFQKSPRCELSAALIGCVLPIREVGEDLFDQWSITRTYAFVRRHCQPCCTFPGIPRISSQLSPRFWHSSHSLDTRFYRQQPLFLYFLEIGPQFRIIEDLSSFWRVRLFQMLKIAVFLCNVKYFSKI